MVVISYTGSAAEPANSDPNTTLHGQMRGDFVSLSCFSGATTRDKPNHYLAAEMVHNMLKSALRKCRVRNGQNKDYLF